MGFAPCLKISIRKQVTPLIRRRPATPSPQGEGFTKGTYLKFQTGCDSPLRNTLRVRYKTGDARPQGEGFTIAIFQKLKNERALETSKTRKASILRREFTMRK